MVKHLCEEHFVEFLCVVLTYLSMETKASARSYFRNIY